MKQLFALVGMLLLLQPLAAAAKPKPEQCPCTRAYNIQAAKIAFLGELISINQSVEKGPGFAVREMELVFKVTEPWRNVPAFRTVTLHSDDTSCGYGDALAPPFKEKYVIGQQYGVFAEQPRLTICNSVIAHNTLLKRKPLRNVDKEGEFNPLDAELHESAPR